MNLGGYDGRSLSYKPTPEISRAVRLALNPWFKVRWLGDADCERRHALLRLKYEDQRRCLKRY